MKIKPRYDNAVPRCSQDCPSFTRRLRKDGEPSKTRSWYCAVDDGDYRGRVCEPAVKEMADEIARLEGELDMALCRDD